MDNNPRSAHFLWTFDLNYSLTSRLNKGKNRIKTRPIAKIIYDVTGPI